MNSCTHALTCKQHMAKDCAHVNLVTRDGEIEITVSAYADVLFKCYGTCILPMLKFSFKLSVQIVFHCIISDYTRCTCSYQQFIC